MTNPNLNQAILNALSQILGIEPNEVTPASDFTLDLNATPAELSDIKQYIETQLDTILPEIDSTQGFTVGDLQTLVDDSLL